MSVSSRLQFSRPQARTSFVPLARPTASEAPPEKTNGSPNGPPLSTSDHPPPRSAECRMVQAKLDVAEAELRRRMAQIQALQSQVNGLEEDVHRKNQRIIDLEVSARPVRQLDDDGGFRTQNERLQQEIERLRVDLEVKDEKNRCLARKVECLEAELNTLRQKTLQTDVASDETIRELKAQLSEAQSKLAQVQALLSGGPHKSAGGLLPSRVVTCCDNSAGHPPTTTTPTLPAAAPNGVPNSEQNSHLLDPPAPSSALLLSAYHPQQADHTNSVAQERSSRSKSLNDAVSSASSRVVVGGQWRKYEGIPNDGGVGYHRVAAYQPAFSNGPSSPLASPVFTGARVAENGWVSRSRYLLPGHEPFTTRTTSSGGTANVWGPYRCSLGTN